MPSVCIDCGHGGEDSGAVGVSNGLFESHAVLDIGLIVRDILYSQVDVIMTREDDTFVSLPERSRMANIADVDIFVSLHLNSATNASASGFEVFTSGSDESVKLAGHVLNAHAQAFACHRNRGVKRERFSVLVNTAMPAVLWEGCFLSNDAEAEWVANDSVRVDMAEAVANGILSYFGMAQTNRELTLEERVVRIEKHLGI